MHESLFRQRNTAEDIRGLVNSSWKRDKGNQDTLNKRPKSWEERVRSFRIQLSVTEVSLMEMETGPSSRKGLCGHPPKVWKHSGQREGEVYSLPQEAQNVMTIVERAVPRPSKGKNREKARERIYFPVCVLLTKWDSLE